jgi:hypothetical protein
MNPIRISAGYQIKGDGCPHHHYPIYISPSSYGIRKNEQGWHFI